jgi:hypothetical protein
VAPTGVEPDPIAVLSGHQAVAIVLDLVDPCRAAGRLLGRGRGRGIFAPGTRIGSPIEATERMGKDGYIPTLPGLPPLAPGATKAPASSAGAPALQLNSTPRLRTYIDATLWVCVNV